MPEADVVVAGAGHNSLITAAFLARAGLEVTVLEARDIIGGNTVTEELTLPSFKHDSCSSAHVLIQSNPLIRNNELQLDKYGLTYIHADPAVVMPFAEGSSLTMWIDRQKTAEEIARFSRADARAYLKLLDDWDTLKPIHSLVSNSPPTELALDGDAARRYAHLNAMSARDVVFERFEHPNIRSFILWLAFATIQPPARPGTGILPFAVTAGRQEFGWTIPQGGSGALPNALARLIEDHGGRVVTSAPVERILVHGGRATGVVTASGETFSARRAVVSTIHVAQLERTLPPGTLPDEFTRRTRNWRPGTTLFAVHLALEKSPHFILEGRLTAAVAGALGTTEGLLDQVEAFNAGRTYPEDPWVLVVCPTAADPGRAPNGGGTLKILTIAPYELADGSWDAAKPRFAEALVAHVAARMDFDPGDELARIVECPVDLAARNRHNHLGSCHGGDLDPTQSGFNRPVPGWAHYRMPVEGLYQTGATTHPGGSVSGRPGRNAARVILADLGIDTRSLFSS